MHCLNPRDRVRTAVVITVVLSLSPCSHSGSSSGVFLPCTFFVADYMTGGHISQKLRCSVIDYSRSDSTWSRSTWHTRVFWRQRFILRLIWLISFSSSYSIISAHPTFAVCVVSREQFHVPFIINFSSPKFNIYCALELLTLHLGFSRGRQMILYIYSAINPWRLLCLEQLQEPICGSVCACRA